MSINLTFYLTAYLIGSIPFGLVLAKLFANINIKEYGSGNIGATNVMRVLKEKNPSLATKLSALTVFLDGFKSLGVLLFAKYMGIENDALWAIGVLCVFGHCVSIYLLFEGGKGVATFFGVMLFFYPLYTLGAIILWVVILKFYKVSSLASLIALSVLVFGIFFFVESEYSAKPMLLLYAIVVYKHYNNIVNIFQKKESKIV